MNVFRLKCCAALVSVALTAPAAHVCHGSPIAVFQDDLQPTVPKAGWSYLWNGLGPVGSSANYQPLLPVPQPNYPWYNATGFAGAPQPAPSAYLLLADFVEFGMKSNGHSGPGYLDAASGGIERYIIARYTVPSHGVYAIAQSSLMNTNYSFDGLGVRVFVDDILRTSASTSSGLASKTSFDINLGHLTSGSRIDVAVGAGAYDFSDAFQLRYSIFPVPEIDPAGLGSVLALVTGTLGLLERRRRTRC